MTRLVGSTAKAASNTTELSVIEPAVIVRLASSPVPVLNVYDLYRVFAAVAVGIAVADAPDRKHSVIRRQRNDPVGGRTGESTLNTTESSVIEPC